MEVQRTYGDQVAFIGVPGLAATDDMIGFIERTGVESFPHIDDNGGEIWDRFGVTQQRTYAFVNDDGSFRLSGYGSLRQDVEGLIAQ